jgi:hypothetical protein
LSIDLYFRKVAHLAGLRVRELVAELAKEHQNVTSNMLKQIEHALSYVMTKKTGLFKQRHLDQIILAVVYAIAKVNRLVSINFKVIIEKYLKQPHAKPQVYRQVLLSDGSHGDIIKFYNSVFLPELESVILQYEVDSLAFDDDSAVRPAEELRALMSPFAPRSPQKIKNLLVSPRRTPLLFHNRDGPSSLLINIGDIQSPRVGIDRINRLVQQPSTPTSTSHLLNPAHLTSAKKKLDFGLSNMDPSHDAVSTSSNELPPPSSPPRKSARKSSKRTREEEDEDDDDEEYGSAPKKPRK